MENNIIVKRGYKSINRPEISFLNYINFKEIKANFHRTYESDTYNCYTLCYLRGNAKINEKCTFEMKISTKEIVIIELLNSKDYSNFLIAKALIKQKLKSYEISK